MIDLSFSLKRTGICPRFKWDNMKGFEIIKNNEAPIYAGVEYGSVSVSVNMALDSSNTHPLVIDSIRIYVWKL